MKMTKKVCVMLGLFAVSAVFFSCGSTANLDSSSAKKTEKPRASSGGISGASSDSTGSITGFGSSVNEADKLPPAPKKVTEAPKFTFSGSKLQIELENMYYDGFELVGDAQASGSYALKLLNDSSWAIAEINFPAGSYEALVNEFAPDSNHARFNLYLNNDTYLVYGSEPPIAAYELTTRAPVSFTLDTPTTVTLKIQQNDIRNPQNNGHNGMTLDFVSFKKIN